MRSFTDIFIKHPVLAVVVNLVIVLVGWRALTALPVQQYPQIESSSVVITTIYYGASAETVRGFLTTPIERVVSAISGVDYLESTSRAGISTVTVHLKLNHSSTAALAEVTARLQQVRAELPDAAEPPVVELQRADRPYASFYLSFSSTERSVSAVTDWLAAHAAAAARDAGRCPASHLRRRPTDRHAHLDRSRPARRLQSAPGDVQTRCGATTTWRRSVRPRETSSQINLLANTDLRSADEFEDLIVADRGGAIVRLNDVAQGRARRRRSRHDRQVQRDGRRVPRHLAAVPGVNEIEVAHRLRDEMERIRPTLPTDIDMQLAYDGTMFMENALTEITKTLVRDDPDRRPGRVPLHGLGPNRAGAARRDAGVADRRGDRSCSRSASASTC